MKVLNHELRTAIAEAMFSVMQQQERLREADPPASSRACSLFVRMCGAALRRNVWGGMIHMVMHEARQEIDAVNAEWHDTAKKHLDALEAWFHNHSPEDVYVSVR